MVCTGQPSWLLQVWSPHALCSVTPIGQLMVRRCPNQKAILLTLWSVSPSTQCLVCVTFCSGKVYHIVTAVSNCRIYEICSVNGIVVWWEVTLQATPYCGCVQCFFHTLCYSVSAEFLLCSFCFWTITFADSVCLCYGPTLTPNYMLTTFRGEGFIMFRFRKPPYHQISVSFLSDRWGMSAYTVKRTLVLTETCL